VRAGGVWHERPNVALNVSRWWAARFLREPLPDHGSAHPVAELLVFVGGLM
jgi:hypothetical protein